MIGDQKETIIIDSNFKQSKEKESSPNLVSSTCSEDFTKKMTFWCKSSSNAKFVQNKCIASVLPLFCYYLKNRKTIEPKLILQYEKVYLACVYTTRIRRRSVDFSDSWQQNEHLISWFWRIPVTYSNTLEASGSSCDQARFWRWSPVFDKLSLVICLKRKKHVPFCIIYALWILLLLKNERMTRKMIIYTWRQ